MNYDEIMNPKNYEGQETRERFFRQEADNLSTLRRLLAEVQEYHASLSEKIRGILGAGIELDEMAFIFPKASGLMVVMRDLLAIEGYELFNRASDIVETSPILSQYAVEYWFARTPFNYRLELMRVLDGYSPLHRVYTELEESVGSQSLGYQVHASFKCSSLEAYAESQYALRQAGYECVQRCESTYGKFSYYAELDDQDALPTWYIKPRVNLRDGGM